MWLSTVTSKGQLTVPKEMRERFGIRDRDRVIFTVEDGNASDHAGAAATAAGLAGALASDVPLPGGRRDP